MFGREFYLAQGLENGVDLLCEEKSLCVKIPVGVGAFVVEIFAEFGIFCFNNFQFIYEEVAQTFNGGPYFRSI